MNRDTYAALLKDLQKLEKRLADAHMAAVRAAAPEQERMRRRHAASETGGQLDDFVQMAARKSAVQFLLRTVYVRVLEDLGALSPTRIRGGWGEEAFRAVAPALGKRAYFAFVFRDLAVDFPALFTPGPDELDLPDEDLCRAVWRLWHQEDGRGNLLYDWQPDATGEGGFDSRFLGDLYQDLDGEVRKRYALLQTPVFVERYILDKTLTPALAEFDPAALRASGETFRVLDPTCGSGHFLVGAFHRMADYWESQGLSKWDAAARALESVWGCDINPHAVDIARFRLLLEVRARTGVSDLDRLAALPLNLRVLDSLIPWERANSLFPGMDRLAQYATPEERAANAAFLGRAFHLVVGNPPYIAPKDAAKAADYRVFWPTSCFKEYTLNAPFLERFLTLGCIGAYTGQITGNNFCKRTFGKGVITKVLSKWRTTAVVDTSLAPIPGHGWKGGTSTVIILGRAEAFSDQPIPWVLARRRESTGFATPEASLSWQAIVAADLTTPSEGPFVAVEVRPAASVCSYPWDLRGEEAGDLTGAIETAPHEDLLSHCAGRIGTDVITRAPEAFEWTASDARRVGLPVELLRRYFIGDDLRDWTSLTSLFLLVPYVERRVVDGELRTRTERALWAFRRPLSIRFISGGVTLADKGLPYISLPQVPWSKHGNTTIVAYPFVTTDPHFVVQRGESFFKDSVKLFTPSQSGDAYSIIGVLNSSTASYWLRGIFKGTGKVRELWDDWIQIDEKLGTFPVAIADQVERTRLARELDAVALARQARLPSATLSGSAWEPNGLPLFLKQAREEYAALTERMVSLQEELDWLAYGSYKLIEPPVPTVGPEEVERLAPGHRPFEILFARRDDEANVNEKSAWWSRDGRDRVSEIPAHYSAAQRARIAERMARIEEDPRLQLLEAPAYKRRWQTPDLAKAEKEAAEAWLLDRLEDLFAPRSEQSSHAASAELATPRPYRLEAVVAAWQRDPRVAAVAGVWSGEGAATDLTTVAEELLRTNAVPDNPYRVYTAEGIRKLDEWKRVWALQDQEDAGATQLVDPSTGQPLRDPATGEVTNTLPVPRKFDKTDFQGGFSDTRGKLNVPRERFILYADLAPAMYGWNGWRDRERALAQVEAYTLAEAHPTEPLPPPTSDDPRRCGPTLGLWESLPDVKRWAGADEHGELQALAREVCRQERCPCPVVEKWQAWRRGDFVLSAPTAPTTTAVTVEERAAAMALFDKDQVSLLRGAEQHDELPLDWLQARWKGAPERLDRVLDDLVATGDLGVTGKAGRRRYRRAR